MFRVAFVGENKEAKATQQQQPQTKQSTQNQEAEAQTREKHSETQQHTHRVSAANSVCVGRGPHREARDALREFKLEIARGQCDEVCFDTCAEQNEKER